jgi:hypothetical protein
MADDRQSDRVLAPLSEREQPNMPQTLEEIAKEITLGIIGHAPALVVSMDQRDERIDPIATGDRVGKLYREILKQLFEARKDTA